MLSKIVSSARLRARAERGRRVEAKRIELLRLKAEQLQARTNQLDPELQEAMAEARARMEAYEARLTRDDTPPTPNMIQLSKLSLGQRTGATP